MPRFVLVAATLAVLCTLSGGAPAVAGAQIVTVDFAEYRSPVTAEYQAALGRPVSSDGFDFYAASAFDPFNRNVLGSWGTDASLDPDGAANQPVNAGNSVAMFSTQFGEQMNMVVGGQDLFAPTYRTFNLYSIDLAHQFAQAYLAGGAVLAPFGVTFFGFLPNRPEDPIEQSFAVGVPANGLPVLTRFDFDRQWRGLEQVVWFQSGMGSGTAHQFTNVRAYVTPEPGTYALVATGLGIVGVVARRRRRTG